jgi:hypothetical protein
MVLTIPSRAEPARGEPPRGPATNVQLVDIRGSPTAYEAACSLAGSATVPIWAGQTGGILLLSASTTQPLTITSGIAFWGDGSTSLVAPQVINPAVDTSVATHVYHSLGMFHLALSLQGYFRGYGYLIPCASTTAVGTYNVLGPTLTAEDESQDGPEGGTSIFWTTVDASGPGDPYSGTADWYTTPGTAQAGLDYESQSGTIQLYPAQGTFHTIIQSKITLFSNPDRLAPRTFYICVHNPVNVFIARACGAMTITVAPFPTVTAGDVSITRDTATSVAADVLVALSKPSIRTIRVNYATEDGTAIAPDDYGAASGTLVFPPGVTVQSVPLEITPSDTTTGRAFSLALSGPAYATLAKAAATITISPAPIPTMTIGGVTVDRSTTEPVSIEVPVTLSQPANRAISVQYETEDVTAVAGTDYESASGTLTFPLGTTSQDIPITVDPSATETDTDFVVQLTGPTNATLAAPSATVTLRHAALPVVEVGSVDVTRDSIEDVTAVIPVTLSMPANRPITVQFGTQDGSARAGTDYYPASGELDFAPGDQTQDVLVTVLPSPTDVQVDARVRLADATNATLRNKTGTLRIMPSPGPIARFTSVTGANGNVTFDAAGSSTAVPGTTSIVSYGWQFDDGSSTSASGPIISHTFAQGGVYRVTLIVTDDTKHASSPATAEVTVPDRPTATFRWTSTGDGTVAFDAAGSGNGSGASGDTYTWNFGDGDELTTNEPTIAHTFSHLEVTYPVSLTVTDTQGDTSQPASRAVLSPRLLTVTMMSFIPSNYLTADVLYVTMHPQAVCQGPDGLPHTLVGEGDNRGFDPTAALRDEYRSLQRVTLIEDNDAEVTEIRELPGSAWANIGTSESYVAYGYFMGERIGALEDDGRIGVNDDDGVYNDCILHHGHAEGVGNVPPPTVGPGNDGTMIVRLRASVRNGLITVSPRIDYDVMMAFSVSGADPTVTITGKRDNFPAYEIYVNYDPVYEFAPAGLASTQLPVLDFGPWALKGLFPIFGNAQILPVECVLYATISPLCH